MNSWERVSEIIDHEYPSESDEYEYCDTKYHYVVYRCFWCKHPKKVKELQYTVNH